jgi:hypothetical protein
MSDDQSNPLIQGGNVFRGLMSKDLDAFQSSREKYVALEAARSVIKGLVNDENTPNRMPSSSHEINNDQFKNTSNVLFNEIFELQSGVFFITFENCVLSYCIVETCVV